MITNYGPGKFDTNRDAMLHRMAVDGWANESTGDVEAPTGYVWLIVNTRDELSEIGDAFDAELTELDLDVEDVAGCFVMTESSQGFVSVASYATPGDARTAYMRTETEYDIWADTGDDLT